MKKIFTFLIIMLSIFIFSGCSIKVNIPKNNKKTNDTTKEENKKKETKKEEKKNEEKEEVSKEDLTRNIVETEEIGANGKLILFVENKNDISVSLNVEVEFYNDTELITTTNERLYGIGAKSKVAFEIYDSPEEYTSYKVFITAESLSAYKCYVEDIDVKESFEKNKVTVQITNNSDDEIDYIKIGVVYYKKNKAVGISEGIVSSVKSGKTVNLNVNTAYDKDYNVVEYDTYKVFVDGAYSYSFNY